MRKFILPIPLLVLAFITPARAQVTWYSDKPVGSGGIGGPRYSPNSPAPLTDPSCTGKGLSTYNPAGGAQQPCPFDSPIRLWNDKWTYMSEVWVASNSDVMIVREDGRIAGADSASVYGVDDCYGLNTYCAPPDLPSHTQLLGKNYASCSTSKTFQDATAPTQVGDPAKQTHLFAYSPSGQTPAWGLSVATSNDVQIKCLDLSGNSTSDTGRAGNGIFSGNTFTPASANIAIQDVTVHGFADSGWRGNIGGDWHLLRTTFQYNAQSGVDNDPGNNQPNVGTIYGSYVSIFGNGCGEEVPVVHSGFAAANCRDQDSGGSGDAWGTSLTRNLNIVLDHGLFAYNTQDAPDFGHTIGGSISVTNSQFYGNMGGNFKCGPGTVCYYAMDLVNANCKRMSVPIGGNPGFNSLLDLWCRAGDQNSMALLSTAVGLTGQMTSSSGIAISGDGDTIFLTQLHTGDIIVPGANDHTWERTVVSVIDDHNATISSPFPSDITDHTSVIIIPPGGATSSSTYTVTGNSLIGYGATFLDVTCQTGLPQAPANIEFCAGYQLLYTNNIAQMYSNPGYRGGLNPGAWNDGLPTTEDYNLFNNFDAVHGTGSHDVHTSAQFTSQPASPIVAESDLDAYNFHLSSPSPAKHTGLAGLATDFYGDSYYNPPSMGGVEFGGTPPPPGPMVPRSGGGSVSQ